MPEEPKIEVPTFDKEVVDELLDIVARTAQQSAYLAINQSAVLQLKEINADLTKELEEYNEKVAEAKAKAKAEADAKAKAEADKEKEDAERHSERVRTGTSQPASPGRF